MALWDKLRVELDRAGRVAQVALDEGKMRLDAFRARQRADKSAQALGYAVYRARQASQDIEPETYTRLSTEIGAHEAEAARLEAEIERVTRPAEGSGAGAAPPPA